MGFLTLFLELILIRYLGANIWNLGYFPNLVLMGAFLGMGMGFAFHQVIGEQRTLAFFHLSFFLLMALVLFVDYFHPSLPGIADNQTSLAGEFFFLYAPTGGEDTRLSPFVFVFLATVSIFALVSQRTAKLFTRFAPLSAYTLDIVGSCLGILAFMAMSFFQAPPVAWFAVLTAAFVLALTDGWKTRWIPLVPALVIVAHSWGFDGKHLRYPDAAGDVEVTWSPYQRIEYLDSPELPDYLRRTLWANGIGHQRISEPENLKGAVYNMPYVDRADAGLPAPENVLIVGAGSGNDTATALMWNVGHIDAVEIDPAIASIGRRHHPARPYSDPRVNLVVNDGRAFMANTDKKYDIVVFAWADSIVRVSSMSQLRLENYLFTEESMRRAFSLLSDTGALYVFNSFPKPPIARKMFAMIERATGVPPIVVQTPSGGFSYFKVGRTPAFRGAEFFDIKAEIPTDDWPFLHLMERRIPAFYSRAMAAVAAFLALLLGLIHFTTRRSEAVAAPGLGFWKLAFAAMGAAFLLLETKSIIQFSLLFGATWLNNSLVFLGILLLVLAANWTAYVFRDRRALPVIFALLLVSALAPLAYPIGNLLGVESVAWRFVLASLLTFSPIFFANLMFSVAFREQTLPAHVFGWNLLGAMAGGVLEYMGMSLGYSRLALVVAACYALAFLFVVLAHRRAPA